jgi:xanthine/CO dehydrogenase XdhC/CoxF family maturation factor
MTTGELLEMARDLSHRNAPYALVTVVRAIAPTSAYLGAQAIVLKDGTLHGWIGGGCAKEVVIDAAQAAIEVGQPKLIRIASEHLQLADDIEQHAMSCVSNGTIELFIHPYGVGAALCVLGSAPDFTVTPSPHHPIGAKGVAESPHVGSVPTFTSAVVDAFAHLGVTHMNMPHTAFRVWQQLKQLGIAEIGSSGI